MKSTAIITTTIKTSCSIIGMDIASKNELDRKGKDGKFVNVKLRAKVSEITKSLNYFSIEETITWKPFPEEPSGYLEAIQHFASVLCVRLAERTRTTLDKLLPFPNRFLAVSIDENRELLLSGNTYEVRLDVTDTGICVVIPPDKHKCSGIVHCARPKCSPFLPLIWVTHADDGETIVNLNVQIVLDFIRKETNQ